MGLPIRLLYYLLGIVIGSFTKNRNLWKFLAGMAWVYALQLITQFGQIEMLIRIAVITALMLGVVLFETWLETRIPRFFVSLGDASYPVPLPSADRASGTHGAGDTALKNGWLSVIGSMAVAITFSVIVFRLVERPITGYLQRNLKYGPPLPACQ